MGQRSSLAHGRRHRIAFQILLAVAIGGLAGGCATGAPSEGRWEIGGGDPAEIVLDGATATLTQFPLSDPFADASRCDRASLPRVSGSYAVRVVASDPGRLTIDVPDSDTPWSGAFGFDIIAVGPASDPWKDIATSGCGFEVDGRITLHRQ